MASKSARKASSSRSNLLEEEEGHLLPPLHESFNKLEDLTESLFNVDLAKEADEAEAEANRLYYLDHYFAALPIAERAVFARTSTIGTFALLTWRITLLHARLLDKLGRSAEALPIAQEVARKMEQQLDLGPDHPSMLDSQYLVAQILHQLGRSAEALPIAQEVARNVSRWVGFKMQGSRFTFQQVTHPESSTVDNGQSTHRPILYVL